MKGRKRAEKRLSGKSFNMLNDSDQIQFPYAALQLNSEDGAKEIPNRVERSGRSLASRADARVLALAADVALARARSGDAAVPSLTARAWPDRAAMAHPSRAGGDRRHRSHRARAHCFPPGSQPVTDF